MFSQKEIPRYERMLESELERTISSMKMIVQMDSTEYTKLLTAAERLQKMIDTNQSPSVSKEAVLTVAGNLLGIVLILKHEWTHPITSKALGFVIRPR